MCGRTSVRGRRPETTTIAALLPLWGSDPATTVVVGPMIQQFVGWMTRLLTGTFRHEGEPFDLIW